MIGVAHNHYMLVERLVKSRCEIIASTHFAPLASRHNSFIPQILRGRGAAKMKSTPCRRIKCSGSIDISEGARGSANYKPTTWSHDFVMSLKNDYSDNINKGKGEKLEKEIRRLLIKNEDQSHLAVLEFIDDIERLGLGYRFQLDIIAALERIVPLTKKLDDLDVMSSLHATSLKFRLLRQHGYEISQDVFRRFKDHNGCFMACLENDVKGLISLYEASFLAFGGEFIVVEAKSFARTHLIKNLESMEDTRLIEQVNHTLEFPLYRRVQKLEARWYIDMYKRRNDAYQPLLQLAVLDFNIVQSRYQTELNGASEWWSNIGLSSKLEFIRDRLMECFIWTIGVVPEPQYSNATVRLTQVAALITTIDDVYDVYGSMEELELFTYAVKRWDVDAIGDSPNYLKLCFLALYNTVNEMASDILKEQGDCVKQHLIKAWVDLCEAFLLEAKWNNEKYMPTLVEYLDNAWLSVSGCLILVHAYFLTNQEITKEALHCLENYHDLLKWSSMIFRLCNDLGTSSSELERGETTNSISCYMRESGVSEKIARACTQNLIDEAWKKMNEFQVADSPFKKPFIDTATNLARIAECTYQYGDGHGAPDARTKSRVLMLVIEPIILMERKEQISSTI